MLRTRAGIEAETRLFAADQEGERREGERKSGTTIAARSHYYMRSTRDAAGRASARLSGRKLKRKQRCLARHRDPCPYPAQIKPTVAFSSVPHSVLFQIPPRPQFSSRPQPTTASVLSRVLVVAQHKRLRSTVPDGLERVLPVLVLLDGRLLELPSLLSPR